MSVIKCAQCGFGMGEGAFDNCPRCNHPVDADSTPVADTENDNGNETEVETESENEAAEEDETETA